MMQRAHNQAGRKKESSCIFPIQLLSLSDSPRSVPTSGDPLAELTFANSLAPRSMGTIDVGDAEARHGSQDLVSDRKSDALTNGVNSTPSFKLFLNALTESFSGTILRFKAFSTIGRVVCGTGAVSIAVGLCYFSPTQALGALAGLLVVRAMSFRENHHIRAQQAVGQTLFATHLALLGAWPAVLQSSLTAIRCTFLGMLPDETRTARIAAAVVGFGTATAIFSSCFEVFPLLNLSNVPIAVMALASAAEAFPKKYSWATRVCYLATAGGLIPYHLFASGSWMGIAINTFVAGTLVRSIYRNDLSGQKPGGPSYFSQRARAQVTSEVYK